MVRENEIEKKLRKMVENKGGACLKWVCPGWSGVPDRVILLPKARIYFVETKKPKGGKISKLQEWWAKRLRGLGFWVFFVFTADDIAGLEMLIDVGEL